MDSIRNPEYWAKFTKSDWEDPKGNAVAACVLNRNETGLTGFIESACKAAGADFNSFISMAGAAVADADMKDKERGLVRADKEKSSLISLSSIEPREMNWLWKPYIPSGAMTIIQGDPGCGKTFLATWITSLVTNGGITPEGVTVDPGSVIFQSMEDGLAEGLVPRLISAGCDMNRCYVFDESDKPLHVQDLGRVEAALNEIQDVRMIIIDPIQSYLGAKVDMNRANEIRSALKGLLNLANQYNTALVLIGHMGKAANKDLHRLLGSVDFVAQARSVLTVGEFVAEPGKRVVLCTKTSNAEKGDPFLYSIINGVVVFDGFRPGLTEHNIMTEVSDNGDKTDEASDFVLKVLKERPMTVKELERQAKEVDVNARTLRRARELLKDSNQINVRKSNGVNGSWYWYLCGQQVSIVDETLVYSCQVGQVT